MLTTSLKHKRYMDKICDISIIQISNIGKIWDISTILIYCIGKWYLHPYLYRLCPCPSAQFSPKVKDFAFFFFPPKLKIPLTGSNLDILTLFFSFSNLLIFIVKENHAPQIGESYMAEQFRQITHYLAEQFRQIAHYLAEHLILTKKIFFFY